MKGTYSLLVRGVVTVNKKYTHCYYGFELTVRKHVFSVMKAAVIVSKDLLTLSKRVYSVVVVWGVNSLLVKIVLVLGRTVLNASKGYVHYE